MTPDTLLERLALRKVQLCISLACLKRAPAQKNQEPMKTPLSRRINNNLERPQSWQFITLSLSH